MVCRNASLTTVTFGELHLYVHRRWVVWQRGVNTARSKNGFWHGFVTLQTYPLSCIQRRTIVLGTGSCHITWWKGGKAPIELNPTERAVYHHWNCDKQGILIVNAVNFSSFHRERRRRFDWWRSLVLTKFVLQSQQMSPLDKASPMIRVMVKILKVSTDNNNYWMYHKT